jgi:hypothetical protein
MPFRVADDPLVLLNSHPEKLGNRVEEKTETKSGVSGLVEKG